MRSSYTRYGEHGDLAPDLLLSAANLHAFLRKRKPSGKCRAADAKSCCYWTRAVATETSQKRSSERRRPLVLALETAIVNKMACWGLATIHPGQPPQKVDAAITMARVVGANSGKHCARMVPPIGLFARWQVVMKVSKNLIARIGLEGSDDLKPHRLDPLHGFQRSAV